jgi:hypothetical protein
MLRAGGEGELAMSACCPAVRLRALLILLALGLVGCASKEQPKVDENAFPADYKKKVIATVMATQSYDPTNIREASITEPALKPVPGSTASRYVACVRFNARNMARQYMGLSDYIVYFYAGDVTQFLKASGDQCAGAAYQPFPELEKICLGQKCT